MPGRLEVAVVALDDPGAVGDLDADVIYEGGLKLAVPADHRFAQRGTVDVRELAGEPWVVGDPGAGDSPFGAWPGLTEPRVAYAVRDWTGRLALVAAGMGVAVVPGLHESALPPGVVVVSVDEPVPIRRFAVAVARPDRSPGAAALIACLRRTAAEL